MTMPYLVLVSLLMTGMLLFITLYQSIQIHIMKVELKKCLKAVKEEKTKEKIRKAIFMVFGFRKNKRSPSNVF